MTSSWRRGLGGSSPLTRGTRDSRNSKRPASAVHPCLRGELECFENRIESADRFIPAYAGNSAEPATKVLLTSVHPRLRGELITMLLRHPALGGSSPLTRGTRRYSGAGRSCLRFIPAYAGNSYDGARSRGCWTVHPRLRGELRRQGRHRVR